MNHKLNLSLTFLTTRAKWPQLHQNHHLTLKGKQLLKQWALSALAAIAKSSQDSNLDGYWKDKFSDDTQQVWGRLCKCFGQKFQPYMEVAIPCLLQSARLTLPDDANIEESDDESSTTQFYQHAEVRIAAALAMPEILKSSKAANDKRLLQKSPFEKLCYDIIPAFVEALVKVIL
ncbi:hypothetical protein OIU84_025991 [Salix udensis]|uniref:ARM repeat superfamily protein n=1 Tax=Salix udensis TaxID=889485 RepID=A0AAD6KKU0_9ROSI|nr:hypothetical protein OIU84_025991 [Salix udensis]